MELFAAVFSTCGVCMPRNEDNFFCGSFTADGAQKEQSYACQISADSLFAVFDGMGGESDGHIISRLCADLLAAHPTEYRNDHALFYRDANRLTNQYIHRHGDIASGSAAVILSVCGCNAFISNIGDSRAYLLRDGRLCCLTEDHTAVQWLVRSGLMTKEQAAKDNRRHALTQYIGVPENEFAICPFLAKPIALREGDRFLLCSDGVHDTLDEAELASLLSGVPASASQSVRKIAENAILHGSKDNITALSIYIGSIND